MINNEPDTTARFIVSILILAVGIGITLQLLEGYKLDDEPVRMPYVPTYTVINPTYAGTANTTTTTL